MRWYWTKIAFGALGIFVVGFGILSAVRGTRRTVDHVVRTNADISFPLPFVPFTFDGVHAGKFRRLVIHRSEPERLSGFDLSVRVPDAAMLARFTEACHLTVDDPKRLTNNSSFRCVQLDSSMQVFGEVTIQARGADGQWTESARVPLVLPRSVVAELEGRHLTDGLGEAETEAVRVLADSIRAVSQRMPGASAAERVELRQELSRLQFELRELERAVAEVSRTKRWAEQRAVTKVEVEAVSKAPIAPKPEGSR